MPFAPLLAALAGVRDPRRAQGQRYSMRHLLLFSVLAILAGAVSYQGIVTFIGLRRDRLNTVFGARFRRAPAVNILRHLFLALDRDDLEAAFRRHACALSASTPEVPRTIALDGKALRGSVDHRRWCTNRLMDVGRRLSLPVIRALGDWVAGPADSGTGRAGVG